MPIPFIRSKVQLIIKNPFFSSSLIYVVGAIFLKGAGFILIPLYTKRFTPSEYGRIEFINSLTSIVGIFLTFGFSQLLYVRHLHLNGEERREFSGKINSIYCLFGLPLYALAGFLVYFTSGTRQFTPYQLLIVFSALSFTFLSFFQNNLYSILQLHHRAKQLTINRLVVGILILCLNYSLIVYGGFGILAVFISNLISLAVAMFALRMFPAPETAVYFTFHRKFKNGEIWSLIKQGYPFIITSLAYFAISGIDRFLIKAMLGEQRLGIYSLSYKFASMYEPLLITPILGAYTPYIFKKFSEKNLQQNVKLIVFSTFLIAVPLSLLTVVIAGRVIDKSFYSALIYIPYLVIGYGFLFLAQIFATPILYFQNKRLLVQNVLTAGAANVVLNVFFIHFFDLHGCVIAFLASNFIWFILTLAQANKIMRKESFKL